MALDTNALSSIAATLGDLTDRIGLLAAGADEDDESTSELREVERQLQTSGRRLNKLIRQTRR